VQYSTENPFVYDGTQDIYIRPEIVEDSGGSIFADWSSPSGQTMDDIETAQSQSVYLDPYTLYQFTIRTKYSGTLTAYSTGSMNTVGYLTTGLLWDDEEGVPYNIKAENDNDGSGSNFKLTYDVTAGTTYHLWVRCYHPEKEGRVTVVVEPPGAPQTGEGGKMYLYIDGEWVPCTPYIRTSSGWKECTPNVRTSTGWKSGT
jgi:hypothetical protein